MLQAVDLKFFKDLNCKCFHVFKRVLST